jgi:TfoX/Sxy family transcriptional regulator of competence genes
VPSNIIEELESLLDHSVLDLKRVTSRKMFGCHALWVNENIFALIWKTGRIGVKLPDEKSFAALMAKSGSSPWTAGTRTMAHWVLVPESYHRRPAELRKWVAKAYEHFATIKINPKGKKTATSPRPKTTKEK